MAKEKEGVFIYLKMGINMKAFGQIINKMVKVCSSIKTIMEKSMIYIQVNSKKENIVDLDITTTLIQESLTLVIVNIIISSLNSNNRILG